MSEFSYDTVDATQDTDWQLTWVSVRYRTHMYLAVTACSDVKIMLSSIVFNTDEASTYVITIDASDTNRTYIE